MKGLLLFRNTPNTYYVSRFNEEANKLGIVFQEIPLDEIRIAFSNEKEPTLNYRGKNIDFSNSVALMRPSNSYKFLRYALINYLHKKNIRLLNLSGYIENIGTDNKLEQYIRLNLAKFPIVQSIYTNQQDLNDDNFIVKPIEGSKGEGIEKLSSFLESKNSTESKLKLRNYIIQKYIETDGHYRVIILGNEVLGGMFLKKKKDSLISNTGEASNFDADSNLRKLSLEVANLFKFELCGIDYVYDVKTNRWLILEVNMMPNFEKFEKSTGINFAGKVINHLLNS